MPKLLRMLVVDPGLAMGYLGTFLNLEAKGSKWPIRWFSAMRSCQFGTKPVPMSKAEHLLGWIVTTS